MQEGATAAVPLSAGPPVHQCPTEVVQQCTNLQVRVGATGEVCQYSCAENAHPVPDHQCAPVHQRGQPTVHQCCRSDLLHQSASAVLQGTICPLQRRRPRHSILNLRKRTCCPVSQCAADRVPPVSGAGMRCRAHHPVHHRAT